ncbi:RMD1 family protein [Motiliproteus sediminis]|uniref:RMD1 family protein n=1 Tax=Motiliproteus sediminis TaxID=1468178 RepID=UPI001AEFE0FE|nr:RMD1 family protein [Motiliproteus sediminis]
MTAPTPRFVLAACIAQDFDPDLLPALMATHQATRSRGSWHLVRPEGEYIIFGYGTLVVWSHEPLEHPWSWLEPVCIRPLPRPELDHFSCHQGEQFRVHEDHILLDQDHLLQRVAVSHAIAQSCKLASFEEGAKGMMLESQQLTNELAQRGRIRMGRKSLARWRGRIHQFKTDIVLRFDLLDTPDFFWEYPELQPYYDNTAGYLELEPRVTLIQHKLDTLGDVLAMLAEEQKHGHSSFLEWIIIWLIAIEIVIFFVHDLFGWV